ncbi:MAG: hypothetical protein OSA97_13490 [Nevskia sp.]|nr:hypothetical protein [Nevskia sp.]
MAQIGRRPSGLLLILAASFAITGVLLYVFGGIAMFMFVAVSHSYDLSPETEETLSGLIWSLLALPAIWLIALVLAVVEYFGKRRTKRFILYAALPVVGAVIVVGVTWLAAWLITLPQ